MLITDSRAHHRQTDRSSFGTNPSVPPIQYLTERRVLLYFRMLPGLRRESCLGFRHNLLFSAPNGSSPHFYYYYFLSFSFLFRFTVSINKVKLVSIVSKCNKGAEDRQYAACLATQYGRKLKYSDKNVDGLMT